MRTARTLSISLPPSQLKAAERLAKRENRTMSELFREAFRRYEEERRLLSDPGRPRKLGELETAVSLLREEARHTPAGKLSMRQIDAEIKAARKERRARAAAESAPRR